MFQRMFQIILTIIICIMIANVVYAEEPEDCVVLIRTGVSKGSGVIISENGLIVTNHHVIEDAEKIRVFLNNDEIYIDPIIVGVDIQHDLALLKIDIENSNYVELAESFFDGEEIFTLGFGNNVLQERRHGHIRNSSEYAINISAIIDNGNSGGGVFNTEGELVGVMFAAGIYNDLAIPSSFINSIPEIPATNLLSEQNIDYFCGIEQMLYTETSEYSSTSFYLNWTPVHGADYHCIYIDYEDDGIYQKADNIFTNTPCFYWYYDYSLLIHKNSPTVSIKVSTVIDGIELFLADPVFV